MTPKEKAKELFDKMCLAIATESTEFGYYTNVIHAKKCALIAVEELIYEADVYSIWDEVKSEIESYDSKFIR
jgi:hypothetical protein